MKDAQNFYKLEPDPSPEYEPENESNQVPLPIQLDQVSPHYEAISPPLSVSAPMYELINIFPSYQDIDINYLPPQSV